MAGSRRTLDELKMKGDFIRRHIGPGDEQIEEMLAVLGLKSLDELVDKTVPASIRSEAPLNLQPAMPIMEMKTLLRPAILRR